MPACVAPKAGRSLPGDASGDGAPARRAAERHRAGVAALRGQRAHGVLGAVTLASYLFVYTPLKRVTVLNTAVGAVPGALPPLMGWAASTGGVGRRMGALRGAFLLADAPFHGHRLVYRDDHRRPATGCSRHRPRWASHGGIGHPQHHRVAGDSLYPYLLDLAGRAYLVAAVLVAWSFLGCAIVFAREPSPKCAKFFSPASFIFRFLSLIGRR